MYPIIIFLQYLHSISSPIYTPSMSYSFGLPMVPAFNAYLPTQIKKENLLKANSIVNISWQTAVLIGPIIAAQLLTFYPVENLFYFCVFFYFLAAALTTIAPHDIVEKEKINTKKIIKKTI